MPSSLHLGGGYSIGSARALQISDALRRKMRVQKRNDLAERVSIHGSVPRAAVGIGVSRSYGRVLWGEVKRGLGAQAV